MKKKLSPLCKEIKIKLIMKDMTIGELADEVSLSREYVNSVANGRVKSPPAMRKICDFLDIVYRDEDQDNL